LANYTGILGDQPKLGVNDDKVVLSWNNFRSDRSFGGSETLVLQKSALLSGGSLAGTAFGPDATLAGIVSSQSLTGTTTEWLSSNKRNGRLAVIAVNGTPAQGNVTWTEYDLTIFSTATPPSAEQPSGPPIETNDDRLLAAVWRGGVLWTSGNDQPRWHAFGAARL
jgi:hypothetical protein